MLHLRSLVLIVNQNVADTGQDSQIPVFRAVKVGAYRNRMPVLGIWVKKPDYSEIYPDIHGGLWPVSIDFSLRNTQNTRLNFPVYLNAGPESH